ncbi:MAG: hypothetical protein RIM72_01940 [Alphaproteobacteria bacterium]
MQLFIRNLVIPFIFVFGFAIIGFLIIGSDSFEVVITADGVPVEGALTEENAAQMTEAGVELTSYAKVFGMKLPGEAQIWQFAILFVFCFVGFRIGKAFKIDRGGPDKTSPDKS